MRSSGCFSAFADFGSMQDGRPVSISDQPLLETLGRTATVRYDERVLPTHKRHWLMSAIGQRKIASLTRYSLPRGGPAEALWAFATVANATESRDNRSYSGGKEMWATLVLGVALLVGCSSIPGAPTLLLELPAQNLSREQVGTMDASALLNARTGTRMKVRVGLSEHTLVFDEASQTDDARWLAATVEGYPANRGHFAIVGDDVAGTIGLPSGEIAISGTLQVPVVRQFPDSSRHIFDPAQPDGVAPPEPLPNLFLESSQGQAPGEARLIPIRVLVVMTRPLFQNFPGGFGQIQPYTTLIMNKAREAFRLSQTGIELSFSFPNQAIVEYPGAWDNYTTLNDLTPHTSDKPPQLWLGPLNLRRQSASADIVVVLTPRPAGTSCGIAWIGGRRESIAEPLKDMAYNAPWSVAVVNVAAGCSDYTLAHELGHILGAVHDRRTQGSSSEAGAFNYSFGHSALHAPGRGFTTIMGYENAVYKLVGVFSNPAITDKCGQPCGVRPGLPGEAANSLGFQNVHSKVVTWRYERTIFARITEGQGRVISTYEDGPQAPYRAMDCPGRCATTVPSGRYLTLKAIPSPGYVLVDWRNTGCDPKSDCVMHNSNLANIVEVRFVRQP